jgi:hypothetical protein
LLIVIRPILDHAKRIATIEWGLAATSSKHPCVDFCYYNYYGTVFRFNFSIKLKITRNPVSTFKSFLVKFSLILKSSHNPDTLLNSLEQSIELGINVRQVSHLRQRVAFDAAAVQLDAFELGSDLRVERE